jgi:hypothetical protein
MMLNRVAALLGIPVLVDNIRDRAARLVADVSAAAKDEARFVGVVAAFGVAAAAAGFVTFVALIIAIVAIVDRNWGHDAALLAAVLIPALVTAVLAFIAYRRVARREREVKPAMASAFASVPRPPAATPPPREAAALPRAPIRTSASTNAEVRGMLAGALGEFFAAPPRTGTPLDGVVRKLTEEAAASSDHTVDLAADMLSSGSRKAVFGILAGTVALGWFLSRKPSGRAA